MKLLSLLYAVKKQPRQWAAWTRQEEESFFNALRLVGKVFSQVCTLFIGFFSTFYLPNFLQDFDKITRRVQTKNKDQVLCLFHM